jgi:Ankyrin repeats (3 copies)/NACHT domain
MDWLDPEKFTQHYGFFYVNGKPGVGKSTLMKFIYTRTERETADNAATISFFFNARGHDLERSTLGMHRSLLWQLLEKLPDLQEVLDSPQVPRLDFKQHSNPPTWEIDLLCDLFSDAIERLGQRRLTCFVDALDECDAHQVRAMVDYFEDLGQRAVQTGSKLYICFSSRHYPHISIQYGRQLTIEDQDGHEQDLEKYVRSKFKAGKGKVFEEVRTGIIRKAAGIFLWVVLVVPILNRELERGRIFAVRKRLQEVPAGLSELFKDILKRDNEDMDDLLLCIQWILYARRPLTREEFYFAVVSGLDPDPVDLAEWNPEHISTDVMTRFVLSSSKGLAEITKSKDQTIQFIHESVRDFLLKDRGLWELWPELGTDIESLSHDRLKRCCHTYMKVNISGHMSTGETLPKASSGEAKKLRLHISNRFPFLKYATHHVLYHADAAAARLPQDEFLENFALKDWIKLDNLFQLYEVRRHTASASLPYLLAEYNWARLIRIACRHQPTIDIEGERHRYPLFAAMTNGHRDAVRALLQQETSHSQEADISAQLDYGQDFKVQKGLTPLLWAIRGGYEAVGKLLLETGKVDVDSKDENGQTPLSWAAKGGYETVIKLLLETGKVDADSKDKDGWTPLSWAARGGYEAIVKLLLETGKVDTDSKDNNGQTPLLKVAKGGHEAVVKLLFETGKVDTSILSDRKRFRHHLGRNPTP